MPEQTDPRREAVYALLSWAAYVAAFEVGGQRRDEVLTGARRALRHLGVTDEEIAAAEAEDNVRGDRTMSAYANYQEQVRRYRIDNPNQRDGQAHFNTLCDVRLDIANGISGGPADPFYLDVRLPEFHKVVAARMGES